MIESTFTYQPCHDPISRDAKPKEKATHGVEGTFIDAEGKETRILAFCSEWGEGGWASNWYPCAMTVQDLADSTFNFDGKYACTEIMFMHLKHTICCNSNSENAEGIQKLFATNARLLGLIGSNNAQNAPCDWTKEQQDEWHSILGGVKEIGTTFKGFDSENENLHVEKFTEYLAHKFETQAMKEKLSKYDKIFEGAVYDAKWGTRRSTEDTMEAIKTVCLENGTWTDPVFHTTDRQKNPIQAKNLLGKGLEFTKAKLAL